MKKNKIKKRIRECEEEIENLKALPYYTIFNLQAEQEKDIAAVQEKLSSFQSQYSAALADKSLNY